MFDLAPNMDAITGASMANMANSRSMQEMRMMRYMQSEAATQGRLARHPAVQRAVNSFMGDGFDPSAMDMQYANELLGHFGQHMPENPVHNVFLPNDGFFGRHDRLSAAIEGGLLGAANARNGMSVGENISGGIQGGLAGIAQRRDMLNQQYEAPFRNAQMVAGLQDQILNQRYKQSQIDYNDQRPDLAMAKINADTEARRVALGEKQFEFDQRMQQGNQRLIDQEHKLPNEFVIYARAHNWDPYNLTPEQYAKVHDEYMTDQTRLRSIGPNISASSREKTHGQTQEDSAHKREYSLYAEPTKKASQFYQLTGKTPADAGQLAKYDSLLSAWDRETMDGTFNGSFPEYWQKNAATSGLPTLHGSVNTGASQADQDREFLKNLMSDQQPNKPQQPSAVQPSPQPRVKPKQKAATPKAAPAASPMPTAAPVAAGPAVAQAQIPPSFWAQHPAYANLLGGYYSLATGKDLTTGNYLPGQAPTR